MPFQLIYILLRPNNNKTKLNNFIIKHNNQDVNYKSIYKFTYLPVIHCTFIIVLVCTN